MRFSITFLAMSLTSVAIADLHYNAICVDTSTGEDVYNGTSTAQACEWYYLRDKGTDWWNTCPDCVMITTGSPHCNSAAKHIGGDEITYYCQLAGSNDAKTS